MFSTCRNAAFNEYGIGAVLIVPINVGSPDERNEFHFYWAYPDDQTMKFVDSDIVTYRDGGSIQVHPKKEPVCFDFWHRKGAEINYNAASCLV
jgi:hypothetical protein